ncbi:Mini-chromosome maintenance complex-binding protein [Larimichthys crocea]|uniref:Uncharacterized protein n=1 Tax=Larimichthys crocea TaxID=215358 RepID=A0ACD3QCY2_LARCR|nr:Mini-chromosome maintenance complex-binding protein [Larimichthys crocea]
MMPSTHDWINCPLGVVEGMFAASQNNPNSGWEAKAVEFFKNQLKEKDAHTWVPSLNDVPLHYLKPNSLVKFRCFIQDMFDPEFFMGVYETVDPSTKAKVLRCGKYKDVTECGCSLILLHSYASTSQARVVPSTSYAPTRQKRSYEEDDDDMDTQPQKQREPHAEIFYMSVISSHIQVWIFAVLSLQVLSAPQNITAMVTVSGRRPKLPSNQTASASHLDLNFPLPGEKGPSCLVKVYEDWESFKLNDLLEVYGILSVNPALSALADEKDTSSSIQDPTECMETAEEQRVHSPPASLVPRLHMLYARPLPHNNPLLPCTTVEDNSAFLSSSLSEMASVRDGAACILHSHPSWGRSGC